MTRKLMNIDCKYLNSKCFILMAKFSRKLYRIDGTILRLQDKNIIEQIMHHCDQTDNSELHTIYTQLRLEILKTIGGTQLDNSMLKFTTTTEKKPLANKSL